MDETRTDRIVATSSEEDAPARQEQRHPVLRAIMFGSGCLLILIGFALGFLPLLPGFPLGLLGIGLLAASSTRVRAMLSAAVGRLPFKWRRRLHLLRKEARKWNGT